MSEPAYELSPLTAEQARVLAAALELYARIGMGQIEHLLEEIRFSGLVTRPDGAPVPAKDIERAEALVYQVKQVLTQFAPNTSKGIAGPATPRVAQIAYEMYKAIRHRLAWDRNPQGGLGVDFDDPHALLCSGQPPVTLRRAPADG